MKAALFYGGPDIRVEEIPRPEPGPGEVLVRVRAAGICGSDLHGYRRARPAPEPGQALVGRENGHELAGTVAALGPDVAGMAVSGLTVGQRVGIEPEHLIGCGRCVYCRRGDEHLCPTRGQRHGERQGSHGFSEYDVCAARNVHALPDSVSDEAAAILDCYACAVHAVHRAPVLPYATIAVIGTGAIGMNVGQVARASGARRVVMVGTRPEPLTVAEAAGAADTGIANSATDPVAAVLDLTGGEGADVVFETVGGTATTLDQAWTLVRHRGRVVVLGVFEGAVPVRLLPPLGREVDALFANCYGESEGRHDYAIAIDWIATGKAPVGRLLTHRFSLEEAPEAFRVADDKRSGAVKVQLFPAS